MDKGKRPTEILPTRASLLVRLKNTEDNKSWQDFVTSYRPLVYGVAKKAGLTDSEAEDAVQETFITAAKYIKKFQYDPSRSFKAWLLKIARCRFADELKKRPPVAQSRRRGTDETARTGTIERVPDASRYGFEAKWDNEQRYHLRETTLDRLRDKVNPKHYQIFDAYVIKGWPIEKVKTILGVTEAQVHKVKSRIVKLLTKEAERHQKRALK